MPFSHMTSPVASSPQSLDVSTRHIATAKNRIFTRKFDKKFENYRMKCPSISWSYQLCNKDSRVTVRTLPPKLSGAPCSLQFGYRHWGDDVSCEASHIFIGIWKTKFDIVAKSKFIWKKTNATTWPVELFQRLLWNTAMMQWGCRMLKSFNFSWIMSSPNIQPTTLKTQVTPLDFNPHVFFGPPNPVL